MKKSIEWEVQHYGVIVDDYETQIDGRFVRQKIYKYNGKYYIETWVNGNILLFDNLNYPKYIGRPKEKENIKSESEFLKDLRKKLNLTQLDMCKIINKHRSTPMTPNNYRQYEYGRRRLPRALKDVLSEEFNIDRKLFEGIQ